MIDKYCIWEFFENFSVATKKYKRNSVREFG